jgi:putative phage-type endonuclease|tara:strand:+ start:1998 stop:2948 length:951 start_codon:yes stop_codon:yes gene_type:complete
MKYISTNKMNHQKWLDLRRGYIGASDAGAVLGFNPYRSAVDVYLDKIGQSDNLDDNLSMLIGREMEPTIKKLFEDYENVKVRNDNKIRLDDQYEFLGTNLDGVVVGETVPVEYKTAAVWDEIPDYYFCQIQHQMMVTGAEDCYLAVLVLGRNKQFIVEKVKRVDNFVDGMKGRLVSFWNDNVLKQIPPQPESLKDAKKLYISTDPDSIVDANEEVFSEYLKLNALNKQKSEVEHDISLTKKNIMIFMQDKEVVERGGIPIVTWKKSKAIRRFDRKRFSLEQPDTYKQYTTTKEGNRRFLLKDVEPVFAALEGERDE